ncbi:hypothetical protein [Emergencia sp. 1XD21-10]|uniref:hypothetical protein n=1 Tax=Emergencia sp. 1XD21-10 TaxID=2304569 RepID=UPI001379BC02|nr:hypothetical protein [Emergencia sp. 1XD21-10]NCF00616.1 hypothetical protein [Emergencia sp. 1XD21-10]
MFMAVVLILSTTFAWAGNGDFQTEKPIDEIELPYTYPTLVKSIFSITSGTAKCGVDFLLKSDKTLDYILVTAKVKKSTGTVIKTFTEEVYPDSGLMKWRGTYKLQSKGTYYLDCTIKCYKGGIVKETITTQSEKATY